MFATIMTIIGNIFEFFSLLKSLYPLVVKKNRLKKILPFDFSKDIALVHGNKDETMDIDNVEALLKAYNITIAMFGNVELVKTYMNYSLPTTYCKPNNIFSISGPKWNTTTNLLLGKINAPIQFVQENITGIKRVSVQTPNMRTPTYYDCSTSHYGVIFAKENVDNHNVLICSGDNALSTKGCLQYLTKLYYSKEEFKKIKKIINRKEWGLLLKVELTGEIINISVEKIFSSSDFRSTPHENYIIYT